VGAVLAQLSIVTFRNAVPGRSKIFFLQNLQIDREATQPPVLLLSGFLLRGQSGRGVKVIMHLYLVPRLRMSEAVLLLSLHDFMTWTKKI
jgi:hypothetical protein